MRCSPRVGLYLLGQVAPYFNTVSLRGAVLHIGVMASVQGIALLGGSCIQMHPMARLNTVSLDEDVVDDSWGHLCPSLLFC